MGDYIQFPKLFGDFKFYIDRVAFTLFNIEVYWYGIIIAAGFMVSILLAMRASKKYGFDSDTVLDLALFAIPVSVVLARLFYVIFNWSDIMANPIDIINTRQGGLVIYGGIIGAIVVAFIFARVKKISMYKLADFGIPYLALGQAIGRWGNFVNQEAFGGNTNLPWGMTGTGIRSFLMDLSNNEEMLKKLGIQVDPAKPVHPAFFYESLLCFAIFLFLSWYRKKKKADGEVFLLYLTLYGTGRFFIEGLRTDSLFLGNFRVSQVISFILVAISIPLLIRNRRKAIDLEIELADSGKSKYGEILEKLREEEKPEKDGAQETHGEEGVSDASAQEGQLPDKAPEEGEAAPQEEEEAPSREDEGAGAADKAGEGS